MFILCVWLLEEDGRCWSKHTKNTIIDTILLISVFIYRQFQLWLCSAHHCCARIAIFWTEKRDCRGWSSLDMSFKTPMLSHCSIFILLQVCNRPSGQHIVSLPVSSAVDQTYVADRGNKATCLSPCPLLSSLILAVLFYSFSHCLTLPLTPFVTVSICFKIKVLIFLL